MEQNKGVLVRSTCLTEENSGLILELSGGRGLWHSGQV